MAASSDPATRNAAGDPGVAARSDGSLLRLLRGGSEDAATQLYLRYAHRLRALARNQTSAELARREDVDDIVQSVFGSFFRAAAMGHYDLPAGDDLWRLLLVIALNKIRTKASFHRAAKRDVRKALGGDALSNFSSQERDDETALASLKMVIEQALEQLPPLQQQMAILRIQGHEVPEIAAAVGRSYRTCERALKLFREILDAMLREEAEA